MVDQMDVQQQVQVAEQLQSQLESLERQHQQVRAYIQELEETQEAIERIGEHEPGETLLLPLGSGAYVHAKLDKPDRVLASIGSGILTEEPPEAAKKRLEARKEEARTASEQLDQNMERLETQLNDLVRRLRQGSRDRPGQAPGRGPGPGAGSGSGAGSPDDEA